MPKVYKFVLSGFKAQLTSNQIVVSIMAGIKISTLQKVLPDSPIVRAMPNICATVGEMASAYSFGPLMDDARLQKKITHIFSSTGVSYLFY